MMTIGYYAAEHYEEIIKHIETILLVVTLCLMLGYLLHKNARRRREEALQDQ